MAKDWEEQPIRHKPGVEADLAITLDQQLYPALVPLIEEFARDRNLSVAVQNGTCGISAGALVDKAADMGGFCCPPGLTDRLPGLRFHTLGIGSLALITHPGVPAESVTLEEARALFQGGLLSWGAVKGTPRGTDQRVVPIVRLHCKLRPGHWRLLLPTAEMFSPEAAEVGAIHDMLSQVERQDGAIGYETLWHIDTHSWQAGVGMLKIDGIDPRDEAALAEGRYPLYRVFNITTWEAEAARSPLSDALAAYLVERASDLDPVFGIVPVQELRKNGWVFHGNELAGEPR